MGSSVVNFVKIGSPQPLD